MKQIELLDCTLRDGGYINDWHFGVDNITDSIKNLEQTNVDILEIGFLKDEEYKPSRTVFNSMKQIQQLILPKKEGIKYAAMIEVVNPISLENLAPCTEESVDIIRVIVWKTKHDKDGNVVDALQEGFNYCKGVVEKGYKLCVQPARVDQYSDEEFTDMLKQFAVLNPYAIYVVDSWGTQTSDNILHYTRLADNVLNEKIAIGYHGHNNMKQAFDNAKAFINIETERKLIVDASVYGIGRGAGNLSLEDFAEYLFLNGKKFYNTEPMTKVLNQVVMPIYNCTKWGYSIPYCLTAKYNCNPNYGSYLGDDWHMDNNDIENILKSLNDDEKVIFNKKHCNEIIKQYRKSQLDLAVIIPTCNRATSIDYWLFQKLKYFTHYGIDVIIYDSSSDDKIEAIVKNFQLDGYDNLYYDRYTGHFDGFNLDDKVVAAYSKYSQQYEYLWVCRDGLLPKIESFYPKLIQLISSKVDYLIIDASFRNGNQRITIDYSLPNDSAKFLLEQASRSITLGTMLFSSVFIQNVIREYPIDDTNYSLWQPIAIFTYSAYHNSKVSYLCDDCFEYNLAGTRNSFWNKSGKAVVQWAYYWPKHVESLPAVYDEAKQKALVIEMFDFHPFSVMSLLRIRGNRGLSLKIIKKYKSNFLKVSNTPLKWYYCIALLPVHTARWLVDHEYSRFVQKLKRVKNVFS